MLDFTLDFVKIPIWTAALQCKKCPSIAHNTMTCARNCSFKYNNIGQASAWHEAGSVREMRACQVFYLEMNFNLNTMKRAVFFNFGGLDLAVDP
jgi:hypothetical protein